MCCFKCLYTEIIQEGEPAPFTWKEKRGLIVPYSQKQSVYILAIVTESNNKFNLTCQAHLGRVHFNFNSNTKLNDLTT